MIGMTLVIRSWICQITLNKSLGECCGNVWTPAFYNENVKFKQNNRELMGSL
jgi:hypothetical protein